MSTIEKESDNKTFIEHDAFIEQLKNEIYRITLWCEPTTHDALNGILELIDRHQTRVKSGSKTNLELINKAVKDFEVYRYPDTRELCNALAPIFTLKGVEKPKRAKITGAYAGRNYVIIDFVDEYEDNYVIKFSDTELKYDNPIAAHLKYVG